MKEHISKRGEEVMRDRETAYLVMDASEESAKTGKPVLIKDKKGRTWEVSVVGSFHIV